MIRPISSVVKIRVREPEALGRVEDCLADDGCVGNGCDDEAFENERFNGDDCVDDGCADDDCEAFEDEGCDEKSRAKERFTVEAGFSGSFPFDAD